MSGSRSPSSRRPRLELMQETSPDRAASRRGPSGARRTGSMRRAPRRFSSCRPRRARVRTQCPRPSGTPRSRRSAALGRQVEPMDGMGAPIHLSSRGVLTGADGSPIDRPVLLATGGTAAVFADDVKVDEDLSFILARAESSDPPSRAGRGTPLERGARERRTAPRLPPVRRSLLHGRVSPCPYPRVRRRLYFASRATRSRERCCGSFPGKLRRSRLPHIGRAGESSRTRARSQ